jgi:glycosyltransferase involved in cell wall biosynthesis
MGAMPPQVSIVLPARNEETRIRSAVASLLGQSLDDWELVVVDDGSTDGTRAAVEAIGDERLRVVSIPPSGIARALNVGLEAARAPLVARQDADDSSFPARLERQVAFLHDRPDVAVLGTAWKEVRPSGEPVRPRVPFSPGALNDVLLERNPLTHTTVMFRKDVIAALGGYDERLRLTEDYDLWLRTAHAGAVLWNLDEVLATRTVSDDKAADRSERAQVREELATRWRDIQRRRSAGLPVAGAARRLAVRAAVALAPHRLKRTARRVQGKG